MVGYLIIRLRSHGYVLSMVRDLCRSARLGLLSVFRSHHGCWVCVDKLCLYWLTLFVSAAGR